MSAYGVGVGIDFKFHGMVANTLSAHRLIQHFQEENGPETADRIVSSLYKQYFEEEAHPTAPTTLLKAALDAGVERSRAEAFVGDEYEALPETKLLIREQASNGVEYVFPEPPFLSSFWRIFRVLSNLAGSFTHGTCSIQGSTQFLEQAMLTAKFNNPAPCHMWCWKAREETSRSRVQKK